MARLLVTHLPARASSLVIRQLTQRANSREISRRSEAKCAAAELFPGQELLAAAAAVTEESGQGEAVSGHISELTTRSAVPQFHS